MKYYKELYLAENIAGKKDKIIRKLEQKKFQLSIHLITLSKNEKNQLEIINSIIFLQKDYPESDYFVVGLAKSYEEALEVVEKITQEVYDNTKGADIRSYIMRKEQEG